jgi:hypothetical protein
LEVKVWRWLRLEASSAAYHRSWIIHALGNTDPKTFCPPAVSGEMDVVLFGNALFSAASPLR